MSNEIFQHPNLKIFKQHGFVPQGTSGSTQVIGRCCFCGSNKKFFVNPETKKWDCKRCGRDGGYQMFLKQIVKHGENNFTGRIADKLAEKRGISTEVLEMYSVGYNPVNETFLIPIWDEKKEEIYNIRIYQKSGELHNSFGCKGALYGWWDLAQSHNTIWLCEGEWDAMVMQELLISNEIEDAIVLAVPGANTFKANWTGYFSGKKVHVLYDNDFDKTDKKGVFHPSPGKQGMWKAYNLLKGISRDIDFIHWLKIYPDKFDLNDLYRKKKLNPERTYKQIIAMLEKLPPEIIYPEGMKPKEQEVEKEIKFDGEGMVPEDVYSSFRKWLYLKDITCIDVTFGTVIANRLPGDPVWLFLVGPSGCGKSELIMSLDDSPAIFPISRLTPHTLISGSAAPGGGDPSLIPKLNNKVLAIKDFTGVLDMQEQARDAIFGQLRDAYDGKCAQGFGTGAMRAYESKFGILAGATPAIEVYLEGGTAMGERFLSWKFPTLSKYEEKQMIMRKAIRNMTDEQKDIMREELRVISEKVLNYDFGKAPFLSPEFEDKIMALAYWVSKMRGTVLRNKYSKEIERQAYVEEPARIAIQMAKLSLGIGLFHRKKEVDEDVYRIIKRIGIGSAPAHLESIVRNMYYEDPEGIYTTMDISDILKLPTETCKRFSENLRLLKILKTIKPKGSLIGSWKLSEETLKMIQISGIYQ